MEFLSIFNSDCAEGDKDSSMRMNGYVRLSRIRGGVYAMESYLFAAARTAAVGATAAYIVSQ